MASPITVDFFFAPTSRYSYLASTRMAGLQSEFGCQVDWYPVDLKDLTKAAGHDFWGYGRLASGQYDLGWRRRDAEAWARLYNVPYHEPVDIQVPDPRQLALACVVAATYNAGDAFAQALLAAIFVQGLSPIDVPNLTAIAQRIAGLDSSTFEKQIGSPETASELARNIARARAAAIFGVPSFVVCGKAFWGNDRLPLVRQAIMEASHRAAT